MSTKKKTQNTSKTLLQNIRKQHRKTQNTVFLNTRKTPQNTRKTPAKHHKTPQNTTKHKTHLLTKQTELTNKPLRSL